MNENVIVSSLKDCTDSWRYKGLGNHDSTMQTVIQKEQTERRSWWEDKGKNSTESISIALAGVTEDKNVCISDSG